MIPDPICGLERDTLCVMCYGQAFNDAEISLFAAPGLLYIHVPRTGGTFISNVLEKNGVGSRQLSPSVGGHDGIREVPEHTLDTTLTFASLRDPWSWYASVDAHYRHKGRFDGALHEYFGRQVGFRDVVHGFTRPGRGGSVRMDHVSHYPGSRLAEPGLPGQLARAGIGLYTWMVLRMLCREPLESVDGLHRLLDQYGDIPWGVNAIIDTAQVRDGLSLVLQAWNPDLARTLIPSVQTSAAENAKGYHRGVLATANPDPGIYDPEMQEWIIESDGWLFRRFGFAFPVGHPDRHAVTLV